MKVPFHDLSIAVASQSEELRVAMDRVSRSGTYLRGPETEAFESEWAAYCGQKYCVCCSSGTDALTLAAMALEMRLACVPANTCWYTGAGLRRAGCVVVPCDVGRDGKLVSASASVVPVPLYGTEPAKHELGAALFDGAQAHGWKPPRGSTVTWSFYPTKNLGALGDAGAVTTNSREVAAAVRDLSGGDDRHRLPGQIVSRIDEVQAAVLRVRLRRLDELNSLRREAARWYDAWLSDEVRKVGGGNYHLYPILCADRAGLVSHLSASGVGTKSHYPVPLHRHDAPWGDASASLPGAESWCSEVLSLPLYPGIKCEEVAHVCECVNDFYERRVG